MSEDSLWTAGQLLMCLAYNRESVSNSGDETEAIDKLESEIEVAIARYIKALKMSERNAKIVFLKDELSKLNQQFRSGEITDAEHNALVENLVGSEHPNKEILFQKSVNDSQLRGEGDPDGIASRLGDFIDKCSRTIFNIAQTDTKTEFQQHNFLWDELDQMEFLTKATAKLWECSEGKAAVAISWMQDQEKL